MTRTTVPLVIALDDPAAHLAAVGGKGASLARLRQAGLPVPAGFCVTSGAYSDFIARSGIGERLVAAASAVDMYDPATCATAAREIAGLFAGRPLSSATAAAIESAYAALGKEVPVAVRSSATTEDIAGLSSAGQHDTYLNIRGESDVLDAVLRCWVSLWTPRAISYRTRHGIGAHDVSLAVVVQQFVAADAAGVLFTADPSGGSRDRIVINANWGLGDTVVAGKVTPDVAVINRADGTMITYRLGTKEIMTVPGRTGTREHETQQIKRQEPVLSHAEVSELARTGLAIEELLGHPVDVEWARAGQRTFILQARPITGPAASAEFGTQWNDSFGGDYLWSSGNLGEAIPDVMTPATWSFIRLFMSRSISPPSLPGYAGYGRIGGRFYMNVSMSASLARAAGVPVSRYIAMSKPVFGKLPAASDIPLVRLPRWKIIRLMLAAQFAMVRRVRKNRKRMPTFIADAADRCDRLRAEIQQIDERSALASAWHGRVEPFFLEASDMLAAAGAVSAPALLTVPDKLTALVGEADTAALLSGQVADGTQLASLGPVVGFWQLARGEIDRSTFARLYGHRGPHEAEVSIQRPAEDPGWIDSQLVHAAGTTREAGDLLARQKAAHAATWERLANRQPEKAAAARKMVAQWTRAARTREAARSELTRSFWLLRTWMLRAGELTGRGDDVFFLSLPEVLSVLHGDQSPLASVSDRRATYAIYRALPPYPPLIRGRFDPVRWAASLDHDTGHDAQRAGAPPPVDTISGLPGAPGVAEGVARLISEPEDAFQMRDGEVLVTTAANIGWTLVFPRAAAVVTDVGAPLSHAAIVARELGIPAVLGCGNATARLHSGDRIKVNGSTGTVEVTGKAR